MNTPTEVAAAKWRTSNRSAPRKSPTGADAVTAAVRENLRQGASQIKLMAGGGAASLYDPLDVTEFFEEELRAAVRAAEDWGTYVMVHVYNPRGIAGP